MGTLAVASMTQGVSNNKRVVEAVVTGSSSYATGGDTIPLSTLGLSRVEAIQVVSHRADGAGAVGQGSAVSDAQAQTGYSLQLGGTVLIPKIKYFNVANTEIAAATNLSTINHVVRFIGI